MNSKIVYPNLPHVPEPLFNELVRFCKSIPIKEEGRQWLDDFHHHELAIAGHEHLPANAELTRKLLAVYQNYFPNNDLMFIMGRICNVVGEKSYAPAHCDRNRNIAINYLLETGGDDVKTCFYLESRTNNDFSAAENKLQKDVTLDFKVTTPARLWHCYNVQNFHSVENVETERLLLSIYIMGNPTFEDFCSKYNHLLVHTLP